MLLVFHKTFHTFLIITQKRDYSYTKKRFHTIKCDNMKKIILIIISLILYLPSKIYALDTSASSYILYDMDSGRTILGKNIHDSRLIASITNIMTI